MTTTSTSSTSSAPSPASNAASVTPPDDVLEVKVRLPSGVEMPFRVRLDAKVETLLQRETEERYGLKHCKYTWRYDEYTIFGSQSFGFNRFENGGQIDLLIKQSGC